MYHFVSGGTDLSGIRAASITSSFITAEDINTLVKLLPHLLSLEIIYTDCQRGLTPILGPLTLVKETLTSFSIDCQITDMKTPVSLLPLLECRRLRSVRINILSWWDPYMDLVRLLIHCIYI